MAPQHSDSPTETGTSKANMTRAEIAALFERRQAAYDDLNAAALAEDYADDCVVDSPTGGTHSGKPAVQKVLQAVFNAFLDLKVHTDGLVIDGDHVAHTMTVEGTNIGGFLGLSPSGKPFHLSAVFLYELKDRKIVRERRIYDFTGMLTQIGVLKTKPV